MINLPFYKVLKMDIPTHIKYWIIKNKQIPKHLLEIIDQTPPITLENTLALPLENFKIHGKTEQTQLTGKNLFSINSTPVKNNVVVSVSDNTLTQRNTGTYCRTAWKIENLIVGNKYTLSYNYINTSGCSIQTRIMDSTNNNIIEQSTVTTETSGSSTITFTATDTTHYFRLYSNTLNTSNTDTVIYNNIQFEEGSTATDYEQFCGGVPSPNPEFPQPINNVSGDITISISDENNTNSQEVVFPLAEGQKLMEGDYLADDGVHHVKTQMTLTAIVTILRDITLGGVAGKYAIYSLTGAKGQGNVATNKFKSDRIAYNNGKIIKYAGYVIAKSLVVLTNSEDTLENFNSKIKGSIVEYELAEETIDTFTEAQATKYEEIKALTGYNNITIVDLASSDLAPNVSLKYYAKGWR